jgi:hypothetical protein
MTEHEWQGCTDPTPLLVFLRGRASKRKLRLFAVACSRRVWHQMTDGRSRRAVEVAERYADGLAGEAERLVSSKLAWAAWTTPAGAAARESVEGDAWASASGASRYASWAARGVARAQELHAQADLARDIFVNPFHTVTINPSWLSWHGGLPVSMAQKMYDSRGFSDMPVLADALEEAGCQDADILGHCRSGGEHVRGCWVIDLLLGRA